MKSNYRLFILIPIITALSCKKPKGTAPLTDIAHKVVNRTVKASDPNALSVDINEDGLVDFSYFAQYVVSSNIVHLYIGVNPVNENATKMSEPDDDRFLNMGNAASIANGTVVRNDLIPSKQWSHEFAYLAIRHSATGENTTYEGDWGDGGSKYMPLRLSIKGNIHYGWAQLKYDRTTEELTLIEYAWNRNAGQELKAGQM